MTYFPEIDNIQYEGVDTKNPFAFRHYNPEEVVAGKTMKEHLRFAIAYWHTMTQDGSDPFGSATNQRPWFGETALETAKNRVQAFFEILVKLDAPYFCFHDIDIAPEGESLTEFFDNLDIITDLIKEKMEKQVLNSFGTRPIYSQIRVLLMVPGHQITLMSLLTQQPKSKKAWISLKN